MYCEKCCMIVDEGRRCPVCRSQRVRKPQSEDHCFLIELSSMWAGMLEDVLKQGQTPYICKSMTSAAIIATLGVGMEHIRFYVLYDRLEEARELVRGLFPEGIE